MCFDLGLGKPFNKEAAIKNRDTSPNEWDDDDGQDLKDFKTFMDDAVKTEMEVYSETLVRSETESFVAARMFLSTNN